MRVLIVNNLRAGQGDAGLYDYVRELAREGAEVTLRPLTAERGLEHALRDAEDHDRVVAAGGDGTVSATARLLRNTGIPLMPYPAGTANLIALNLKMPLDPVRLAETTLRGRLLRTDLGELAFEPPRGDVAAERRRRARRGARRPIGFTGIAGAGFDADIIEGARDLKQMLGAGAYLVSAMRNAAPTVGAITMDLDGRRVETEGSAVLLVNFGTIQFDLAVTHDSDGADGLLEVVVIKARHVTELLPVVMAAMLDRIVDFPDRTQVIDTYRARRIEVTSVPPLPLQADGETLGASTPFSAKVLPLAATWVVPAAPAGTLS
jgi:diacylglycerol kinase family enzyme